MKPVFGLVPYDRLRAVDDTGRDLFAAFHRQTMHEDRIGLGVRHQVLVDAVRREHVVAIDVGFVPHRYPGIGDDAIRIRDRFQRLRSQTHPAALPLRPFEQPLRRAEFIGAGDA